MRLKIKRYGQSGARGYHYIDTMPVIVAASDASEDSKSLADYICDGTDDGEEILAAINALPSDGGLVQLTEGDYNLSATLTAPSKSFILQGVGLFTTVEERVSTRLNFALASSGYCIVPSNDQYPQRFANFAVIGDTTNTTRGFMVTGTFKEVKDVLIRDVTDRGIYVNGSQCVFERVYAREMPDSCFGFYDIGVANRWAYCQASRSGAQGPSGSYPAFGIASAMSSYIYCVAENHNRGFELRQYSHGNNLFGCYTEGCQNALFVTGVNPDFPKGNAIYGIYSNGAEEASNGAIQISQCEGLTIVNPRIHSTTSNKSISILGSDAENVTIIGGQLGDTTPISDGGGVNVRIINVHGYINEAKGAAASISDGGTIAHGLSTTPSVAIVSPSVAGEMASVTGLDGANITVAIKQDDGTPGTSQTIYWRAYI